MRLLLLSCLALFANLHPEATLAQPTDPYEGEVPVASQSEADRIAVLPQALAQVLGKLTGDPEAGSDPAFAHAAGQAVGLLQQYRYREDVTTVAGMPVVRLRLLARFDPGGVDALVAQAGRTAWPTPRPRPLLWLAIDDGRGPRLLGEAQQSAVAALALRASERGFGITFPLADVQDQTLGGAQAVWREDVAAIRSAAARYGSEPILIGKLQRGEALWRVQWILLDASGEIARWDAMNAEAAPLLANGADGAASALARHYAQRIMSGPAGDHVIEVTGLRRAEDYGRTLAYLRRLPIVRTVEPLQAQGDTLLISLALTAGIDGLARLVQGGGVLVLAPPIAAPASNAEPDEKMDVAARFQLEP